MVRPNIEQMQWNVYYNAEAVDECDATLLLEAVMGEPRIYIQMKIKGNVEYDTYLSYTDQEDLVELGTHNSVPECIQAIKDILVPNATEDSSNEETPGPSAQVY